MSTSLKVPPRGPEAEPRLGLDEEGRTVLFTEGGPVPWDGTALKAGLDPADSKNWLPFGEMLAWD